MQAVINISREDGRLRPLNCSFCTGMLKVGNVPIAERIIELVKKHGIDDVILVVGYNKESVTDYIANKDMGVNIRCVCSEYGDGALKECESILEESFIYFSHPVYAEADLGDCIKYHHDKNAFVTVVSEGDKDSFVLDKTGCILRIEEKRLWKSLSKGPDASGIYVLNQAVVRFLPEATYVSLSENVLPQLIRSGKTVYVYNKVTAEEINDIASFMRANFNYLDEKRREGTGICIMPGARVEKGALLEAPCLIGENAVVYKGSIVGAYSVIGRGSSIHSGASIKRSIIGEGCKIMGDVSLRGCTLADGVSVGEGSSIYEQAVIGFDTKIRENVLIKSFVKIWPEKEISPGSTVGENIMWGQKKRPRLFERDVIQGSVNVDITPAFCTKIGECLGHVSDMGEVGVSTDGSPVGAMIRDGIVSGLTGSGVRVKDFGEQPLPITRRGVAFYMLDAGVAINVFLKEGEYIAEITIIGRMGTDADDVLRDRLEELYERGDFIYPDSREIKECEYLFEYKLYYLKSLLKKREGAKGNFKILLSCRASWARRLIMSAMSDFSVRVSMYSPPADENVWDVRSFEEAVKAGRFDMGFIIDDRCERVIIVTKNGEIDKAYYEALCAMIVMREYPGAKIYLPITASEAIEKLAEKYGAQTIRTKSAPREMMKHLMRGEDYLTDQFIYRFDAVGAAIKLVEYLVRNNTDLKALMDEIPLITMAETYLEMPPGELEAAILRIKDENEDKAVPEGVKITFDKGWVVVVPDEEKSVCRIVSEGVNAEFATELCDFCVEKLLGE